MSSASFALSKKSVVRSLNREFLCRAGIAAVLVIIVHQLSWNFLRFITSEAILRLSVLIGMGTKRVSFDTILIRQTPFRFVVACTFVDVYAGCIPLLWNLEKSILKNLSWLVAVAPILFGFNVLRLEVAQILFARGVAWAFADGIPGGVAYFVVWLAIWRLRGWSPFTLTAETRTTYTSMS